MNLVIVKYNAGNVQSVLHGLERLGVSATVSDDHETLRSADKVIFPGVGEASTAMRYLKEKQLDTLLPTLTQPFLGVCLGLQLMCLHTEENNTPCMGVFPVQVRRFPDNEKVPHMGWNKLDQVSGPLFKDLPQEAYLYFVHSYYAELGPCTIASSTYSVPFSGALHKDNFYAVQAHPEKSGADGSKVLENFLAL